ncbi:MAG: hypothetical protein ABW199_00600 [Caulobacterales bacterium]
MAFARVPSFASEQDASPLNAAAMCVQAGRSVSAAGDETGDIHRYIFTWDAILRSIPATVEQRTAALVGAESSFRDVSVDNPRLPLIAAQGMVAACRSSDLQYGYLESHSTPALRTQEGLSGAATCVAIAEYLVRENPANQQAASALVGAWTRVMTGILADTAQREAALHRARDLVQQSHTQNAEGTLYYSQVFSRDICAGQQRRTDYLMLWGSAEAMSAAEAHN